MEIVVETTITDVTVYPDRARITCRGECEVSQGTQRLLIEELPLVLEPDSVRVAGKGTAQVRILSVDVVRRHYRETPAAKVRKLEQQIEQLEDEARVLEDRKAGWQAHGEYLHGLRQATAEFAKGLSRGRTTVEDQAQLIAFMQEQDGKIREAQRELDQQQRELDRRLDQLRRELQEVRAARPRQRYRAQVEIEALSQGTFTPELSYVVRKAGWQPLYDVRLLEEENGRVLEVSYIAQVIQNTGQDWQDVQLVVSTARPALNQRLPDLKPWYINVFTQPPVAPQPRARQVRAAAAAPAMQVMADAGKPEMEEKKEAEAEVAVATVQESGTSVTFAIPGGTDVPSDGSPHKTTITRFRLDPELDYLAVPKHTAAVYRRATVTNTSSGPLLAGEAALFVGKEFIGRTHIDYTPTNGEIELLLGVEERITIERELSKRHVDKRFLRDNRQLRYGYEIEIENLLNDTVKLEVHDHIPVARNEEIKVKLEQVDPEPAEKTELNLFEWHLALPAKSEKTIRYEYTVEHPRSLRITGLKD